MTGTVRVTFPLACPPHIGAAAIAEFVSTHLSASSFEGYMRDPAYDVRIARDEDDPSAGPLGYTLAVRREPPDGIRRLLPPGPVTELSKLYVREDAHGSGVAGALLSGVLEDARRADSRTVWLGTNQRNVRARRFYEREGFTLAGTRRFLVGGAWEDDVVYVHGA